MFLHERRIRLKPFTNTATYRSIDGNPVPNLRARVEIKDYDLNFIQNYLNEVKEKIQSRFRPNSVDVSDKLKFENPALIKSV